MSETDRLIVAFEKVEGAVNNLQVAFEKHVAEDELKLSSIGNQLMQHSALHIQHAQMIAATQELALTKTGKEWQANVERLNAQDRQLQKIVAQGQTTRSVIDTIAKYQKHPAAKVLYYIGVAVWGAITAYLAAHHK